MATLKELANNDHSWASERAQMALDIQAQRNSGALSPDEAQELMEDLIATDKLNDVADDMAVKAALITAISIASKFA
jgi:DNA-directed RNA polymerase sigma subunit (sigma70/sigma32)